MPTKLNAKIVQVKCPKCGALTILKTMYDQAVVDLMAHPPKEDSFVVDETWAEGYLREAVLAEAEGF